MASACQSVAGLPSTAASADAPGLEEVAATLPHRRSSLVGARSVRRVGMVSVCPLPTVRTPDAVLTGKVAPLSSVTDVLFWPMVTVNRRPCHDSAWSTISSGRVGGGGGEVD